DRFDERERTCRDGPSLLIERLEKFQLLVGRDAQAAVEPEAVNPAGRVAVAVAKPFEVLLHSRGPDARRQLAVIPDDRVFDRRTQAVILPPVFERLGIPILLGRVLHTTWEVNRILPVFGA